MNPRIYQFTNLKCSIKARELFKPPFKCCIISYLFRVNLHVGMKDDQRAQTKDQTNKQTNIALEVSKVFWSGY